MGVWYHSRHALAKEQEHCRNNHHRHRSLRSRLRLLLQLLEYLRLYELTGDHYFLSIAKILEKNTKQTMNYDGSLRYPLRGLQREAIRCVTHRGDGVGLWLPWCTASALDPLFRMEDAYGKIGIDNILGPQEPATRTAANINSERYAHKLGMVRLPDGAVY